MAGKKIGRNDPCPCGSGKKYKKCCGSVVGEPRLDGMSQHDLNLKVSEMHAMMAQREKQQGRGRPIISTVYQGYRFIAVADRLLYSNKWKTFHDFLLDYIRNILGVNWGNAELKKSFDEMHPILQWYQLVCKHQERSSVNPGTIQEAPMTGAVAAYLGLAYNLYLLAHNVKIQTVLIDRLKDRKQFNGAYYETYVAATFIKAGFELEFENEQDSSTSHCEFTATAKESGHKYSVEAKAREPFKISANVGNQLYAALKKKALHERIVFIDLNLPEDGDKAENLSWVNEAVITLRKKESSMTIKDLPAPPAYVFLSNHPFVYNLDTADFNRAILADGFKIPDFSIGATFNSVHAILEARNRHSDMFRLMDSIPEHYEIPSTFDGEIPAFAFGEVPSRLRIGQLYVVPNGSGQELVGELEDAIVVESERVAYGTYKLSDGRRVIVTTPLTDKEISAYRRHPATFFGIIKQETKQTEDPVELYDFFYGSYRNTPKVGLLELMSHHADYKSLTNKSQSELATIYCESLVEAMLRRRNQPPKVDKD